MTLTQAHTAPLSRISGFRHMTLPTGHPKGQRVAQATKTYFRGCVSFLGIRTVQIVARRRLSGPALRMVPWCASTARGHTGSWALTLARYGPPHWTCKLGTGPR